MHLAGRFGYINVMRTLIETINADINIKNMNGHTLLFLIVSTNNGTIVNFYYLIIHIYIEIFILAKL